MTLTLSTTLGFLAATFLLALAYLFTRHSERPRP